MALPEVEVKMSHAMYPLALELLLATSACGAAVEPRGGEDDGPLIVVHDYDVRSILLARVAFDLRCDPGQIEVAKVARIDNGPDVQTLFMARGCGQVARYACTDATDKWCVREPIGGP